MDAMDELLYRHAAEARDLWLGALPPDELLPERPVSQRFARRMARLLRQGRRSPASNRALRYARRAAAVFLALLLGAGAFLGAAEARAAVLAWARETYGSKVLYRFTDETPETLPRYPAWLPEGFVLADDFQSDISRSLYYVNDETGKEFVFDYSYMYDGTQIELYNPNGIPDPEKLTVNGMEADFYPADNFSMTNYLIWFDEVRNTVFSIDSDLEKSVILHIAESVDLEDSTKN